MKRMANYKNWEVYIGFVVLIYTSKSSNKCNYRNLGAQAEKHSREIDVS